MGRFIRDCDIEPHAGLWQEREIRLWRRLVRAVDVLPFGAARQAVTRWWWVVCKLDVR